MGNYGRVTLTGLQLPSLAPHPEHFLAIDVMKERSVVPA